MRRLPCLVALGLLVAGGLLPRTANAEAESPIALARRLNEAFVEVAERASRSVVVVQVASRPSIDDIEENPFFQQLPEELRQQFRDEHERRRETEQDRDPAFNGEGSGIILRADGHILTNHHVVAEAERIRIKLRDGREFDAVVRGMDRESDIAVLRIESPPDDLVPAKFADSDSVRVGEFALAIGAPFELEYSVSFGHVSAKGREDIAGGMMMDQEFIQTDANINPGNSGGPLVNIGGEVIGVNAMIRGLQTGIGFAIPSNLALEVAAQLVEDGRFRRSWLGIGIQTLRENEAARRRFPGLRDGVLVQSILPEGPARDSGLTPGDVITAVDGRPVATVQQLRKVVTRKRPESEITLSVHRDGADIELKSRTGEMPDRETLVARTPRRPQPPEESDGNPVEATEPEPTRVLGMTLKPGDVDSGDGGEGALVASVADDSPAARAGLRAGDRVIELDRRPVTSPEDAATIVEDAERKGRLRIQWLREGRRYSEVLRRR